jgi:pimeloyl-ACP methyl ester carboxylesterase
MFKPSLRSVKIGDYLIQYRIIGEGGEPVVLVHGLSGSTLWWRRNIRSLAQHHKLYLVDLPGFGARKRERGRFVLKQAADWLLTWLQAIGVKQAHFIGHSMGGYICMEIAAHHPEVVKRLVLVDPAFKSIARNVLGYAIPLLAAGRYLMPQFFPILAYDSLRAGPITLLKATRDIITLDISKEIPLITQPVLLIWGENDTLVPPELGPILRAELPHARFLLLRRAAHVAMFDQPQQFNAAVNAFLRGEDVGE